LKIEDLKFVKKNYVLFTLILLNYLLLDVSFWFSNESYSKF
jgi:hypothetical protein